jgi:hypothetical protein
MMRFVAFLFFLSALTAISHSNSSVFIHSGNEFTYRFTLNSSLQVDSLLFLLYDFKHVKLYSTDASYQKLLNIEEKHYDIEILIKYMFYSSRSVYRRIFMPESSMVKIEMIESRQNSKLFPRILDYHARYSVIRENEFSVVSFIQNVTLDKSINRFYLKILREKLDEFEESLEEYIRKEEKKRAL